MFAQSPRRHSGVAVATAAGRCLPAGRLPGAFKLILPPDVLFFKKTLCPLTYFLHFPLSES
jgi:hypothetical protein